MDGEQCFQGKKGHYSLVMVVASFGIVHHVDLKGAACLYCVAISP